MTAPSELLPSTPAVPFARDLAAHGDRTAFITPSGEISYRELARRVTDLAARLGHERRLVLLEGANTADALVVYLAALAGGHPVLLVPHGNAESTTALTGRYDPDIVATSVDGEYVLDERRPVSAHTLHPDLALLLSTSGSTGSPKLVRLSFQGLQANAESIARYLDIRDSDRAATTLPMHYCYGLSVINSHLLRGAGVILTELSVSDPCFWNRFRDGRGTTFAGVPYTFDLLDQIGFPAMRLPHLRYITQAGGRLAPEQVTRYAALGRRDGWELFVMYGQTEATARMAYLPPHLALSRPQAIGIPVPGGSFRIEPLPDQPGQDTGELVYSGPNVMLGYAETPADLALGRTVTELRTGDIARRAPDGLYELVGRQSRFAKILGLRIDPRQVETMLERHGIAADCLGDDDELLVAVAGDDTTDARTVRRLVAGECGLPVRVVRVAVLAELPRLATGKPDYGAVRRLARAASQAQGGKTTTDRADGPESLCRLYADILDRADVTEDSSFVGLGGDSLTYVEMSVRLEAILGKLPTDWHTRPIHDLRPAGTRPAASPHLRDLDTSVALRAVSIVLIVGSHIPLFTILGGAHVLLGVAGYNFARFHLTPAGRRQRVRNAWGAVARLAVPSVLWITFALLVTGAYDLANVFLLNSVVGEREGTAEWQYWFIETLVYFLVAATTLLAVPALDRAERRFPFGFPMALVTLGLVTRYDLIGLDIHIRTLTPIMVFWLFALGWAAAKARTVPQRLLVSATLLATVPGFFPQPERGPIVMAGLLLLIWVPSLPCPAPLNRIAGTLAAASLYIYLTHYQVYPRFEFSPLLGLAASLAFGTACTAAASRATRHLTARLRRRGTGRQAPPRSTKV
ncbi:AMP-binding protein [Streptomyces sp. NBC_01803]|uniref:AMP-binding protein n=1 Tax=Streptomyces sp. NBC_01803 TaxID=2975946 RepID=UPI002DD7CFB6|nr:AMP-binding protein [Streptomyces sp. NBC_01803]WSA44079.1 AMP-binding protein [Streptomyces sp. NBC_01803]